MQRIGLLTLPLFNNYGGIIQAVALTQFLTRNGRDVVFLTRHKPSSALRRAALGLLAAIPFQDIGGIRERRRQTGVHLPFIRKYIPVATPPLHSSAALRQAVQDYRLDAVIVGSDQVWRPEYVPAGSLDDFFLGFAAGSKARRISYAASFGVGEWQHPEAVARLTPLLAGFHAVSVREESGVEICRSVFGRPDAQVVLDPTLLVEPGFYDRIAAPPAGRTNRTILQYTLDHGPLTQSVGRQSADALGPGHDYVPISIDDGHSSIDVPGWIRGFMDADYVITDSFHGTVFSIIFRKPFVSILNSGRGAERFHSLLGQLGLLDRLVDAGSADSAAALARQPIDYDAVHARLDALRAGSGAFLLSALA